MKKIIFALTCLSVILISCTKTSDDNSPTLSPASVNSTVTSGTWRVTLLNKNGTDKTTNFNGFKFMFAAGGSLAGANDILSVSGTWSTRVDNSKVKLTINFPSPSVSAFLDLNEDWEVTGRTDIQVTMQHISGGGGGTDYLTIQKN